jgi:hypothetical protein
VITAVVQTRVDPNLLVRYLAVFNRSLGQVRLRFPFNVLLEAMHRELGDRVVIVAVSNGSSASLRFDGSRLSPAPPTAIPSTRWTIEHEHLCDVVRRPAPYLADPTRLQLPPFSLCVPRSTHATAIHPV